MSMADHQKARVLALEQLSPSGWRLDFERLDLDFSAGQVITLHGRTPEEDRTYTLACGESDSALSILFRHIPEGKLTPQLVRLKAGDEVAFSGAYGEFTVHDLSAPLVFVATGTGVAPCRAYARTHPDLNLTLIHGVRKAEDLFFRREFEPVAYHPCVSREEGTGFHGRVTDFFRTFSFAPGSHFHLCGANEMIFEMHGLLKERGVDDSHIHTEAYYYRLYS